MAPIFSVGTFSINTPFFTLNFVVLSSGLSKHQAHRLQTSHSGNGVGTTFGDILELYSKTYIILLTSVTPINF